ncbi:MAG: co-chaperone YbbN [Alphaproteobacteria bacterium]|jgi:putative thioredoxin|nr:co-chaperone YbbN [Alphaproteobacteria bacterium]
METLLGQTPPATGGDIIDSTQAQFAKDVLDASRDKPVIVDFWAPWCGPCKQLTPALEKVVTAAKGAVKLVKINIDENQALAQQLRIQSIPTVYAFYQGRPVDGFMGALPESQLKEFIAKLMQTTGAPAGGDEAAQLAEVLAQAKEALDSGDMMTASQIFSEVLQHDPANVEAIAGMTRCYLKSGDIERAKNTLAAAPKEQANHAEIVAARAAIELAEAAKQAGPVNDLKAKVQANPKDHQARFDLAMALYASGEREGAVDALLEIVRRDRKWNEEGARKQLVKFFEALGPMDPLTIDARKRLSSILFS